MTSPETETAGYPPYEEHLRGVHRRMRDALTGLLASVGADPRLPQELSRRFGLNHTTAWKLCKVIQEADPHVLIQHMPGPSGTRNLIRAVQRQGAPDAPVRAAEGAVAEFERMIRVHAGDRPTLERMSGSQTSRALPQQREAHRKLSFRGNSCTWGVQAAVQLMASFVAPSATPGMVDYVKVGGLLGFRRLRPDAVWPMISTSSWSDSPTKGRREQPLDSDYEHADELPLLPAFSSDPVPPLRRRDTGSSRVYELAEGPLGMTGATTCLFGLVTRELGSIYRSADNPHATYGSLLSTPAELYIGDIFIHRDLHFAKDIQPILTSRLGATDRPFEEHESIILPLDEELTPLGCPPDVTLPEFPRYSSLVSWVFERLGWDPMAFHGQRLRMNHPPIPSLLMFRHGLMESGESA